MGTCDLEKNFNTYEEMLCLMKLIRINSKIYLPVKTEIGSPCLDEFFTYCPRYIQNRFSMEIGAR
jgi:hypothetical protein